jgi:flagellar export protein FliJ
MRRDPLLALLRVRRLSVDEARRDLAARLEDERSAAQALHEAAGEPGRQAAAIRDLARDAPWPDAYALWLPRGQAAIRKARDALTQAETAAQNARAHLGLACAKAKATEDLLARRARDRALILARKDQAVLDEAGQRPRAGE